MTLRSNYEYKILTSQFFTEHAIIACPGQGILHFSFEIPFNHPTTRLGILYWVEYWKYTCIFKHRPSSIRRIYQTSKLTTSDPTMSYQPLRPDSLQLSLNSRLGLNQYLNHWWRYESLFLECESLLMVHKLGSILRHWARCRYYDFIGVIKGLAC